VENIDDSLKFELLRNPWIPNNIYDFKSDLKPGSTWAFRHQWLHENARRLTYSAIALEILIFIPLISCTA